jgi:hypothetical protein
MISAAQRDQMIAQQRRWSRIVTPEPISVGAPIKGWNTRDPFEAMDPLDAITLDNLYPDYGGVLARGGSASFATGLGDGPVETLATYQFGSVIKFLGACAGSIFDISAGGAVGAALASGFSDNAWQTVNFNGKLLLVNGNDAPQSYNGTALAGAAFTGSGLMPSSLNGIGVFNNRIYAWTGADANFWYGGVNAVTGTLTQYPLSTVSYSGGNLIAVSILSYDGGTGINDYTAFFLDSGEVLMFLGTDPTDPSNWSLTGRYVMPPPISPRAILRYGGDIYITTQTDHLRFSEMLIALKLGATPPRSKISGAQTAAWASGSELQGWQALYYPALHALIFNIPQPNGTFAQHVYNTATQAWCRFLGWNASCFGLNRGNLYFGGPAGTVYKANTNNTDSGALIQLNGVGAWQNLGTLSRKRVTAIRPLIQITGKGTYSLGLSYDYVFGGGDVNIDVVGTPAVSSPWDTSPWDTSPWSSETTVDQSWLIAEGSGSAVAITLAAQVREPVTWVRTDVLVEPGSQF